MPILPSGSAMSTLMLRFLLAAPARGRRSASPTSRPRRSAARPTAVAGSGMITHSMRSTSIRLPPASQRAGSLRGTIVGELLEHRLGARHPFVCGRSFIGPAADIFVDLLERIGLGDPLRHDEGASACCSCRARAASSGYGFLQHPLEGAVVDRDELLLQRLEHQAHGVARRPARRGSRPRPWPAPARRHGT